MTHSGNNARHTGFTAWLALVAVLLMQVSTAAHEAQHAPADAAEVCEICVQLDASSSVDSSAIAREYSPATVRGLGDWSDAPYVAPAYRRPQLRAPPALI